MNVKLLDAWQQVLASCKVKQGESTMRAAGETAASIGPTSLTGNRPAVAAMKSADMVIDLMGIDRGTMILPFKEYVHTPIRLTIKDGYIRKIEGEFDADYLRDYMAKFDDPEGYAVSHLGWGLQKKAHWTALGLYDKRQTNAMEARSFYGNFPFSTGPNLEGGGTRNTPCHLDIPMRNCSLTLDGQPVLDHEKIVPETLRA